MVIDKSEKIWNIPNLLSGYRLLIFPYVLYLIYTDKQQLFLLFFCISIITDILDGAIARIYKLQTKFGAKLDSVADFGSYILAACGLIHFKWDVLIEVHTWIGAYVVAFLIPYIVSYLKYRKFPSLHLYSSKIGGAMDGIFFFYLFFVGYSTLLFFIAIIWGLLSFIEMTAVILLLKELRSDCKGLYWIVKN